MISIDTSTKRAKLPARKIRTGRASAAAAAASALDIEKLLAELAPGLLRSLSMAFAAKSDSALPMTTMRRGAVFHTLQR